MLQYSDSDFFEFQKIRFDEEDRASYQMHKPQINKELSRSLSSARSSAKGSKCFICKNKCDSFCNSHSVPQFCLRKIADKGKVLQSGLQEEFPLLGDDTGVKKAGIFFLICHNCDNTKFQEYENPQSYNQQISQTLLAQIAMKNTLQLISKRKIEYQLYKILEEKDSVIAQEITQQQLKVIPLDLDGYTEEFRYSKVAAEKHKNDRFELFFYQKLNYTIPIAAQAEIILLCGLDGKIINDVYNITPSYKMQSIHIVAFPLENESVVICFRDVRNKRYDQFIQQFSRLSLDTRLSIVNYIFFQYSENVFISPKLKSTVLQNRAFLDVCQTSMNIWSTKNIHTCTKDIAEQFDLKQAIKIPNLLSSQYAM